MSHSVPPQRARRTPQWQQILGAALVAAGLVFGVFAIVALSKPNGAHEKSSGQVANTGGTGAPQPPVPDDSGASGSAAPSSSGSAGPRKESVVILNNTDVSGLAARAKVDLQARGWIVTDTTNYSNDIISTAAYYDPSDPANQQAALELQKQFPWIMRVAPRFPELPDSPIVLILNADY